MVTRDRLCGPCLGWEAIARLEETSDMINLVATLRTDYTKARTEVGR